MYLEIVTPEAMIFRSEVDSVTVPGMEGEFQMLNNHAAIVSTLSEGTVKIDMRSQAQVVDELHPSIVPQKDDKKVLTVNINSGTVEMKDNKVIILAD